MTKGILKKAQNHLDSPVWQTGRCSTPCSPSDCAWMTAILDTSTLGGQSLDTPDIHVLLEEMVAVLLFLLAWYIAASALLIRVSAS